MRRILAVFGFCCAHRNITTPRRDAGGDYVRCNDCGHRIPVMNFPKGY